MDSSLHQFEIIYWKKRRRRYWYLLGKFIAKIFYEKYFRAMGKLIGKAVLDGNMVDIPFSILFYKLVMQHPLQLNDLLVC